MARYPVESEGSRQTLTAPQNGLTTAVTVLILGTTFVLAGFGVVPVLLFTAVGCLIALTLMTWWRPAVAIAATVAFGFGGFAIWLQLTQFVPGTLEGKTLVVLGIVALLALAFNSATRWRSIGTIRYLFVHNRQFSLSGRAWAVALLSVGAVVFMSLHALLSPDGVSFAMNEDAVWNLVTSRFMVVDGGLVTAVHAHSSPFTPGLLGMMMSFGRGGVSPTQLLAHDSVAIANVWLVLIFLASMLAGLISAGLVPAKNKLLSFVAGLVGMLIVLSWFATGWALTLGYENASIALVLLCATWIMWREAGNSPRLLSSSLIASTIALLSTWAPLALIPLIFWCVHVWNSRGTRSWWAHAGSFGVLLAYGYFVTWQDMKRESAALSFDGGMFNFRALDIAIYVAVLVVLGGLIRWKKIGQRELQGALALAIAAIIGVGYLVYQRRGADSLWGYYPAKMAWLLGILIVLVSVSFALAFVARATTSGRRFLLAALTVVGLSAELVLVKPPSLVDSFPLASIALGKGVSQHDAVVAELSSFASPGSKEVVFRLHDDLTDRFENMWLLQLPSASGADPLRTYAYFLNGADLTGLCDVIRVWGDGVIIHTSDQNLEKQLMGTCKNYAQTAEVVLG